MKKVFSIFSIILLLFLTASINVSSTMVVEPEFEWKVAIGDSITYIYSKYVDLEDEDGDGDPYTTSYTNKNGTSVPYVKKGAVFTCEIISLDDYATLLVSIDELNYTLEGEKSLPYIRKTVHNLTYWETYVEQHTNQEVNYSIEGDFVVSHWMEIEESGAFAETRSRINWKTGWFSYYYFKEVNTTHIVREIEFMTEMDALITGFEFFSSFFLFPLISIILVKRHRKKR